MPPLPEVGDVCSLVRGVKIDWQPETEYKCQSNGDICITREIAIDLKSVSVNRHQVFKTGVYRRGIKYSVDEVCCYKIGNNNLLYQSL